MKTKSVWAHVLVFGVSVCLVLLMAACQQPAPPVPTETEEPVAAPEVVEPEPVETAPASEVVEPEPVEPAVIEEEPLVSEGPMDVVEDEVQPATEVGGELSAVVNGSFETWKENGPGRWHIMYKGHGTAVVKCEETPYGSMAVKLVPGEESNPGLRQSLKVPADYAGKAVVFSAAIKSSEEGKTGINLYYMVGGIRKAVVLKDGGEGEWTETSSTFTIPTNADMDSFVIQIGRREGSTEPSCVDNVSLEIAEK